MVRKRTDKVIGNIEAKRKSAAVARNALAVKREKEAAEWKPQPIPKGFPKRPVSLVDYVTDFPHPVTGSAFGNYAKMAKALGTSRQAVNEWKVNDHIPEKYLMAIVIQTGINPSHLMVWNAYYSGRPKAQR